MNATRVLDDKNRIGALLLLIFALAYLRQALTIPLDPAAESVAFTARSLPIGLAGATILLSLVQLLWPRVEGDGLRLSVAVQGFRWRPTLLLTLLMAAYALTFEFLGFLAASALFLLGGFLVLGERRILLSIAVSAGLVVSLWALLTRVFGLYLDGGALYRAIAGWAA